MATIYIGIGSNIGNKKENCLRAFAHLEGKGLRMLERSSLYETSPIGYLDQDWFINCVAKASTPLSPHALLITLKAAEGEMGRKVTLKWGPRFIDLDILLYEDLVIEEVGLCIPHSYLSERLFVLEPLVEIDPGLIHPVLKIPLNVLCSKIKSESKQVVHKL